MLKNNAQFSLELNDFEKMSIIVITSLNKQLKQVTHQLVPKPAQEQDEQQVQPMGNEHQIWM
jgi:hypothetical protein